MSPYYYVIAKKLKIRKIDRFAISSFLSVQYVLVTTAESLSEK